MKGDTTLTTSAGGTTGEVTDATRARARVAVTNALYGGAKGGTPLAVGVNMQQHLLNGGGGVMEGVAGSGMGGVAVVPPKHMNPRPVPQRNFKMKVCGCSGVCRWCARKGGRVVCISVVGLLIVLLHQ